MSYKWRSFSVLPEHVLSNAYIISVFQAQVFWFLSEHCPSAVGESEACRHKTFLWAGIIEKNYDLSVPGNVMASFDLVLSCRCTLLYGNQLMHLRIHWSDAWKIQTRRDLIRVDALGSSSRRSLNRSTTLFLTLGNLTHHNGDDIGFELPIFDFGRKCHSTHFKLTLCHIQ